MKKYLLEIGTEELPYQFVVEAIEQLKKLFADLFKEFKIAYDDINVYATPRRLCVLVENIQQNLNTEIINIKGPSIKIAYDENDNLTKAAIGFAKKNSVSPQELFKDGDYIFAKIEKKPISFEKIIQDNIENLVFKLQGSHFMRWADFDFKFQRPIRWVLSLLNDQELKVNIANIESSRFSKGHRFAPMDSIEIPSVDSYFDLLEKNNVILDQNKRKQLIIELAQKEALKINSFVYFDEDLLNEVTFLTEFPVPVLCSFEEKYLKIPQKVTITVMAVHQRYFPLFKDQNKTQLINKFITIANFIGDDFSNIIAGNERVVKARLEDAIFFTSEDTKTKLKDKLENLKGMTFQRGFGSMYDKTQRIIALSDYISKSLDISDNKNILRTAELSKCDLATKLVFEFTELQGFIGSDYAKIDNENNSVVLGIKEHYYPLNADSELATSVEGQIVGIADKIDNISSVFLDGKKPTGSNDPLGIRRQVLGIIKTVINKDINIDIDALIKKSLDIIPYCSENRNLAYSDIVNFFNQRLSIYLSENYRYDLLDAVISSSNPLVNLKIFMDKINILSKLAKVENFEKMHEAANRVMRILKSQSYNQGIKEDYLKNEQEVKLFNFIKEISINDMELENLILNIQKLTPIISEFFDKVLVMDENQDIRKNRLALLSRVNDLYLSIADFSKIVC